MGGVAKLTLRHAGLASLVRSILFLWPHCLRSTPQKSRSVSHLIWGFLKIAVPDFGYTRRLHIIDRSEGGEKTREIRGAA
jgi:hypothetical protein